VSADRPKADEGLIAFWPVWVAQTLPLNNRYLELDAPEFTDQYIRLGMPGWPSAGNVIPMTPSEVAACEQRQQEAEAVSLGSWKLSAERAEL
jgi:hypothetical protein